MTSAFAVATQPGTLKPSPPGHLRPGKLPSIFCHTFKMRSPPLLTTFSAALCLAAVSSASKCQNLTVLVPVDARNAVFNLTAPTSNIEVTNVVLDLTQQGHNLTDEVLTGVSEPGAGGGKVAFLISARS